MAGCLSSLFFFGQLGVFCSVATVPVLVIKHPCCVGMVTRHFAVPVEDACGEIIRVFLLVELVAVGVISSR